MSLKKMKRIALTTVVLALLVTTANAASTITIAASPAVANAVNDLINDFIGVTDSLPNGTGGIGLGYSISLRVITDAEEEAAIIVSNGTGGADLPDLFLSQSVDVPNHLILKGMTLDGQLINFAKDSLVLYSSGDKQLNIKSSIAPQGHLDVTRLLNIKVSTPDWTGPDPFGASVKKLLGSGFLQLLKNKNKLVITPDMVSSYAAVEVVALGDGGSDFGFTGLSQICSANDGIQAFEPGAQQFIFPSFYDVQLSGVKIANNFNLTSSPTYSPAQSQELTDFVNFLNGIPLGTGTFTGKVTLAQHCYH